ncbi:MAG: thioredoxin domain-containing protein [Cyanobacteriota bacterium]|nr:thioredoxin domain-containing protein [Cyanobacteriota bacterium]
MPIPIPKSPPGYNWGHADAPIQVEMFMDFECPFSKDAWLKVLKVANTYGKEKLRLKIEPMSLSNHRQSWDVTKAAFIVAGDDTNQFINFASYLFNHQHEYSNGVFKNKTLTQLHNLLAEYAADAANWQDKTNFLHNLESKEIYQKARIPARLAIIRGVWSTPTFFINGFPAEELSSKSTVEDWQTVINPLLN